MTPSAVRGLEIPGLDGTGVTVARARYGHRSLASVPAEEPASGHRPDQPGQRCGGAAASDDSGPAGATRHGAGGNRLRIRRARWAARRRARASILPVRIAGWQPDAEGGYTVYSRTDQIIAGLEAAVDPERGRRHPGRRSHRARRSRRAVCVLPGRAALTSRCRCDRAGHARRRPGRERRARRAGVRQHRRAERRAGSAHRRCGGRASRDADGPRSGPSRACGCSSRSRCRSAARPEEP